MRHLPVIACSLAVAFGGVLTVPRVAAHEGPEHEIEELNERLKVEHDSPDLWIQRAIEYRVLGKLPEAAKDLERALLLDGESIAARRELSQTYFALGKTNEALAAATRALKSSADAVEQASVLMVRAGILRAREDFAAALRDADAATRLYSQNAEWYLIRSQLQHCLQLTADRAKGLEEGIRETGSGLLIGEWVDALIEAGHYSEASAQIERELKESRWRAGWLIRRAKVRLRVGEAEEAKSDLSDALQELDARLGKGASDALLLADRAMAYDLLGKKDDARRDYQAAFNLGLTDEWLRRRIRTLRE